MTYEFNPILARNSGNKNTEKILDDLRLEHENEKAEQLVYGYLIKCILEVKKNSNDKRLYLEPHLIWDSIVKAFIEYQTNAEYEENVEDSHKIFNKISKKEGAQSGLYGLLAPSLDAQDILSDRDFKFSPFEFYYRYIEAPAERIFSADMGHAPSLDFGKLCADTKEFLDIIAEKSVKYINRILPQK